MLFSYNMFTKMAYQYTNFYAAKYAAMSVVVKYPLYGYSN